MIASSKPIYSTAALAPNGITDPIHPCRPSRVCWMINAHPRSSEAIKVEDEAQLTAQEAQLSSMVQERLKPPLLQFTRLQPTELEVGHNRREFREFMAREALLDEEYWTAAWLRAESHWENQPIDRYTNNYKRKFAEQEFSAIKRRCQAQHGQRSTCIVTVRKGAGNMKKHTVLKSIVGTLDLSVRHLLQGESYPGERVNPPLFCTIQKSIANRYGYIANLCVSKSARRKGIATNMMLFALESAKSKGIERVFVHVRRDNAAAQQLYQDLGFQIVESATSRLVEEMMYLLYYQV